MAASRLQSEVSNCLTGDEQNERDSRLKSLQRVFVSDFVIALVRVSYSYINFFLSGLYETRSYQLLDEFFNT